MVFDIAAAPSEEQEFMKWYEKQTEWSESHSYSDHSVTSEALQNWFMDMINLYPPMNGPLASDDVDDLSVTDYSIGTVVIYAAFSWSESESAYLKMKELAEKHSVGFFNASSDQYEVVIP